MSKLKLTCGGCGKEQLADGNNLFAAATGGWDETPMEFEIIFECGFCDELERVVGYGG